MQQTSTQKFTALIFLRDVGLGLLLWLLLTAAVGEARVVPTGSMEPTIAVGDRIWTDKLFVRWESLERGDIVVFDPPFPAEDAYLKRIVGLPGETVEVKGGYVWIDGKPLAEPYAEVASYRYGPVQIPAGEYFVLGDNRNISYDSHRWGLLSRDRITARAVCRIWPFDRAGRIDQDQ
ncbi:MAG TPA: signal peptidase I [Symbiobacteriaceae bacterium]|nr:signal peptidase I [Symbiobacteriaceae bacterium]